MSAAIIICSYTHLASRWFPPSERTFATSIAVQCNYAGWCVGTLIPLTVTTVASLNSFMLWQALFGSSALVLFLLFHREKPKGNINFANQDSLVSPPEEGVVDDSPSPSVADNHEDVHDAVNPLRTARELFGNLKFDLQCL